MRQRRFFSFRVFVALVFFFLAGVGAFMTMFGSYVVLGPQPPERLVSVQSAVNTATGAEAAIRFIPAAIGPGMGFQAILDMPGGLDGHALISYIEIKSDHELWPAARVSQFGKRTWPNAMPDTEPKPIRVTISGLGVPRRHELMHREVVLDLIVNGVRPELDGPYLVDAKFTERFEILCRLGRGSVEPSGAFNFDPYNRWTTGMFSVFMLIVTSWMLRLTRTPLLRDPTLPELKKPRR